MNWKIRGFCLVFYSFLSEFLIKEIQDFHNATEYELPHSEEETP